MNADRRPIRSMLFIPGNRTELLPKAIASGADAVIIDLEDAVPVAEKDSARAEVAAALAATKTSTELWVRVNPGTTGYRDVAAIVGPHLAGIAMPKTESPVDVSSLDHYLNVAEEDAGVPAGTVRMYPLLETALGIYRGFEIAQASNRTMLLGGISTLGGDVERSFGYRWSKGGAETFGFRSQALTTVRAAGVLNPLTGMWADIRDLTGLEAFAAESRSIGYEGMLCIHPSHVDVIHRAFTPTEAEIERDRALLAALEQHASDGVGALVFDGQMVDEAMARTSRMRIARHNSETIA